MILRFMRVNHNVIIQMTTITLAVENLEITLLKSTHTVPLNTVQTDINHILKRSYYILHFALILSHLHSISTNKITDMHYKHPFFSLKKDYGPLVVKCIFLKD